MIVTRHLTKRFGRARVVDGIDLDVREGDRYGFLGPNGSGKTTTVRMLLGLVYATSGEIEVMGRRVPRHVRAALAEVGALVEAPAAYGHLSARANLDLVDAAGPSGPGVSRTNRTTRINEALEIVGLAGVGRQPVRQYSYGMRQRLGLAAALVRRPRLLVLDEPSNGLDPQGMREIRDLLLRLNAEGTTLFLSSHLLAEVDQLCNRVGILDRGRLVAQDDVTALRAATGRAVVRVSNPAFAARLLDGKIEERDGDRLVVSGLSVEEVTSLLVAGHVGVLEAVPERWTLEDAVLALTSHGSDRVGKPEPEEAR